MKKTYLCSIALAMLSLQIVNAQHTITIHQDGYVASLELSPAEYSNWIDNFGFDNSTERQDLVSELYQTFEDDFDFIFFVLNESAIPNNYYSGRFYSVFNDTQGLGIGNFDNTASYGSSGQLQGVLQLTRLDLLRLGPSLHELSHRWGNFGIPTESVSSAGNNLTSFPFLPHWGFTGGSTAGQLGGFEQSTLVVNGNNSYTVADFGPNANGANSIPYNELELYLMGMIPVTDVADFDVFTDITSLAINSNNTFTFEASTRNAYTPTSIETLLGARVPSATTSQKDFKGLVVVLTDAPLTTQEWDTVNTQAQWFSEQGDSNAYSQYNFYEATNGLGTMELGNLNQSVLSINESDLFSFKLYPNPVNNRLSVKGVQLTELEIVDTLGKRVFATQLMPIRNEHDIDISTIGSGTYFVKVQNASQQTQVRKMIVK